MPVSVARPASTHGTGALPASWIALVHALATLLLPLPLLQFKQTDGSTLPGEFAPDTTLQQVCHYIDTHRTGEQGRAGPARPVHTCFGNASGRRG